MVEVEVKILVQEEPSTEDNSIHGSCAGQRTLSDGRRPAYGSWVQMADRWARREQMIQTLALHDREPRLTGQVQVGKEGAWAAGTGS